MLRRCRFTGVDYFLKLAVAEHRELLRQHLGINVGVWR